MAENKFIEKVIGLAKRISMSCLDKDFELIIKYDQTYTKFLASFPTDAPQARVYIQILYKSKCSKTGGDEQEWKGRKWYLSEHMTDSEIVFTVYAAFKAAVEHEIMEGFKIDNKILVNPHINFEALLKVSNEEVKRT